MKKLNILIMFVMFGGISSLQAMEDNENKLEPTKSSENLNNSGSDLMTSQYPVAVPEINDEKAKNKTKENETAPKNVFSGVEHPTNIWKSMKTKYNNEEQKEFSEVKNTLKIMQWDGRRFNSPTTLLKPVYVQLTLDEMLDNKTTQLKATLFSDGSYQLRMHDLKSLLGLHGYAVAKLTNDSNHLMEAKTLWHILKDGVEQLRGINIEDQIDRFELTGNANCIDYLNSLCLQKKKSEEKGAGYQYEIVSPYSGSTERAIKALYKDYNAVFFTHKNGFDQTLTALNQITKDDPLSAPQQKIVQPYWTSKKVVAGAFATGIGLTFVTMQYIKPLIYAKLGW